MVDREFGTWDRGSTWWVVCSGVGDDSGLLETALGNRVEPEAMW